LLQSKEPLLGESLSEGQSAPEDTAAYSMSKLLIALISALFIRCMSRRKSDDIKTKPQCTLKLLFLHQVMQVYQTYIHRPF
jgi:hypothetical protein